jgi:hypothetical protein
VAGHLKMKRCRWRSALAKQSEVSITSRLAQRYSYPLPSSAASGNNFSVKAEQKGIDLSELLTDVLRRDIEINEALK